MIVNGVEVTHVDALLTDFAIGYSPKGFIADRIFPVIDVGRQSDIYAVFEQADQYRHTNDWRAPGDMANEVRMRVSSAQYHCKNYALSATVPDELAANADPVFRNKLEQSRTRLILNQLHMGWEIRAATLAFTAANVGSSAAVASSWGAAATGGSDPVGDINTALDNVQDATGYRPNRSVIGLDAWRSLRRHEDVIARATNPNFNGAGEYPSAAQVANIFDLEEIIVAGAFRNNAQEGVAQNLISVWSAHMLLYYNEDKPDFDIPTFGATFNWMNGPMPRLAVEKFKHDDERKAQKVQAGFYQDERIVASALGYLLTGVNL